MTAENAASSNAPAERDWVAEIGKPAYESIAEMVAALECDYDALSALREERDAFEFDPDANAAPDGPGYLNDREAWAGENPDEADRLKELEAAAGDHDDEESARRAIEEDALSVEVRSGWATCDQKLTPEEFAILLTTGGPAVRIRGDLGDDFEPSRAWLEVQDWGKPWTQYFPADAAVLLAYARCFRFSPCE